MDTNDDEKQIIENLSNQLAQAERKIDALERAKRRVGLSFRRVPETGYHIQRLWDGDFPYLEKICNLSYEKPVKDSTFSVNGNTTLIEGDNLAVLASLQFTHKGKVDVIYIDPPYNTGNNDFIYNDARKSSLRDIEGASVDDYEVTLGGKARSVGKDDPERHSLWLSFMEKRLFLAKDLLSDTGVILVSIDDNEQARLKLLMDEVFGEQNFISSIIYDGGLKNNSRFVSVGHDYIFIYSKKISSLIEKDVFWEEEKKGIHLMQEFASSLENVNLSSKEKQKLLKEWLRKNNNFLDKGLHAYSSIDDEGRIYSSGDLSAPGQNGPKYDVFHPVDGLPCKPPSRGWGLTRESINEQIKLGNIAFGPDSSTTPRFKRMLFDIKNNTQTPRSYFWEERSNANKDLQKILGRSVFDFPKHVSVIKRWIRIITQRNKNAIVLDFFAGSGTTAHAVAELNKEDGGSRQCILVTHGDENGKNIAEDVTAERLKRVLSGDNWADGKKRDALPGSLTYYKLMFEKVGKNPLSSVDIMQDKMGGIISLDAGVSTFVEEETNFDVLRSDNKIVVVWKNVDVLFDNPEEEFYPLLERLKNDWSDMVDYVVYTPSASDSDVDEFGVLDYGWENVSFPLEYLKAHRALVERMKKNQTLLKPVKDDLIFSGLENNVNDVKNFNQNGSN